MTQRSTADCIALVIAELVKGRTTIGNLCLAMGAPPSRSDRVQVYLKPLRAAGLVRIAAWLTQQTPVLEWQTAPFALPDEPRPERRRPKRKTDRRLSEAGRANLAAVRKMNRQAVPLGPNSVFALAVA